jgi:transposase
VETAIFSPSVVGISEEKWERLDDNIQALIIGLYVQVESLGHEARRLRQEIHDLRLRLNQNSGNSSKPPSSDPPQVQAQRTSKNKKSSGKPSGGQPGHHGAYRAFAPIEKVDDIVEYYPDHCSGCGASFASDAPEDRDPERRQVHELPPIQATVTEHRLHTLCCGRCGTATKAVLPPDVPEGAFGPRLQAVISLLTGRYRLSRNEAQDFVENVLGVPIAEGSIYAVEQATSQALQAPYEEAMNAVATADVRHLDETSWKQNAKLGWLWVLVSVAATLFIVARSRGRQVLETTFGGALNAGINVSDRWSAYNGFKMNRRQVCHAHLHRDFIKLEERGGVAGIFGRAARLAHQEMFALLDRLRAGEVDWATFRSQIKPIKKRIYRALYNGGQAADQKAAGMCKEILRHWLAMWTFVRVEGVEPTNNAAERALRKAVLWRKGCFGTRSHGGARFVEQMLTVTETCRKQERDLVSYVTEAIEANMHHLAAPALLTARAS